jgi:recombinational DNA repair protein (RecF pathway)
MNADAITAPPDTRCVECGSDTRPGTARFVDRRRRDDGWVCSDCAAEGGPEQVLGDVPITMPNTNLPGTH